MKKSNKQNKWTLLGFDSQEEYWFDAWLKELNLSAKYKPITFTLSESVKIKQQKSRSIVDAHLLNDCKYTPDFGVYCPFPDRIGDYLFCLDIGDEPIETSFKNALFTRTERDRILIDVKGANFMSSNRTSDIRFPVLQKWIFSSLDYYICSVIPEKLFERTFAPEVYFFTETGKEKTKKGVAFSKIYKRIGDINNGSIGV